MIETVLKVENLQTYFKTGQGVAKAVDGISFEIKKGETFALVGESGCGKSITALSLIQLVPQPAGFIHNGRIFLRGRDIVPLPESEKQKLRGNEVSMIFQEPMTSLNPVFTVGYQIREVMYIHQGLRGKEARKKAIDMLDRVGIPDPVQRYSEYPHQLSGGMKQRVMTAIALACRPSLLIADEPTTALDVTIQAQIMELIANLRRQMGTAVLLITHDLGLVYENADKVAVMYAGHIVEMAPSDELFRDPKHPYTQKLLESLPRRNKRGQGLQTIPGRVPRPTEFPPGCRYTDRCHKAMVGCKEAVPKTVTVTDGHIAACHLYDSAFMMQNEKLNTGSLRSGGMAPPSPHSQQPALALPIHTLATKYENGKPIIQMNDFKVHFPIKKGLFKRVVGHVKAVDGINLQISQGKTLAIVGESGCGKTTLGKALLHLVTPTSGDITYDGSEILAQNRDCMKLLRGNCQIIFQDPYSSLNPRMMIGPIIEEGMIANRIGADTAERRERIHDVLENVGLDPDIIERYPHQFSGGQRQRICIARALAVEPRLIICDEATSALDVSVQAQILNLLKNLQQRFHLTYMFITHDLSVVEYMADEVAVMYLGRIVECGKVEEIFDDPKHPYTRALLSAIPKIDDHTGLKKIRLQGDVPSPSQQPAGCHFHPRCPDVKPECNTAYPGLTHFTTSHTCHCYLHTNG